MSIPYWQSGETPQVLDVLKQRFKFYRLAGILEICSLFDDEQGISEARRQIISAKKLYNNPELCDMFLLFLADTGLITKVEVISGGKSNDFQER